MSLESYRFSQFFRVSYNIQIIVNSAQISHIISFKIQNGAFVYNNKLGLKLQL